MGFRWSGLAGFGLSLPVAIAASRILGQRSASRNRCPGNPELAIGWSQSLARGSWHGDRLVAITESISNNLSVTLNIHFDFMSISLRCRFGSILRSLQVRRHSEFIRFHFDFTSFALRFQVDVTSISLRFHSEFTLMSLRPHCRRMTGRFVVCVPVIRCFDNCLGCVVACVGCDWSLKVYRLYLSIVVKFEAHG